METTAGLTVAINEGNATQALANLEQSLLNVANASDQTTSHVGAVGQTAQSLGGSLSSLSQITTNTINQVNGLGNHASQTSNQLGSLNTSLGQTATQASQASAALSSFFNVRTDSDIMRDIGNLHIAMAEVESDFRAGRVSINELNRATAEYNSRLGTLRAELQGTSTTMDSMSGSAETSIGKLKGVYAGVMAFTASLTGAIAVGATFVNQQIELVDNLTKLARIANTTTAEIQKYTFGAEAMGIETDALGDIFKDTQDKIGDYLTTGGGELADFFDNIAPKIGITAEQLRGLSGDQALGAIYNALEKSNLSYSEQVFYMESIADEASTLIPLLKDNAAGFKMAYEEAERLGLVLDENTIRKTQELKAATTLLGMEWRGVKQAVASELTPVLSDLAGMLLHDKNMTADVKAVTHGFVETLKLVINTGMGAVAIIRALGTAYGATWAAILHPMDALNILKMAWDDINNILSTTDQRMQNIANAGSGAASGAVKQMADLQSSVNGVNSALNTTNEKIIAITGNTAKLGKNGSVHLDVRYAAGDPRYGKEVSQSDLDRLLVGGRTLSSQFKQSSDYGWRTINGKKDFHEGLDYATPMGTKVSTKVPVKSIKTFDNHAQGGGWVTTVEFMDGVKLNLLHLSPQTRDITRQYGTPQQYGQTGKDYQDQLDKQTKANSEQQKRIEDKNRQVLAEMTGTRKKVMDFYLSNNAQALEASRGLPLGLLASVMHTESHGNPYARSPKGAEGLMQLMPATAKRFMSDADDATIGKPNDARRDPLKALTASADYLAFLYKKYAGNLEKTISAYNAGEGNVDNGRYKKFAETRKYTPEVMDNLTYYQNVLKTGDMGISGGTQEFERIAEDAKADLIRQQQEAAKLSQDIREKFNSQKYKIQQELKTELERIGKSDMSDAEKKTYGDMATAQANRKIASYEYGLKSVVENANAEATTATQKIINEYQKMVIDAPADLYLSENADKYEQYIKNAETWKNTQLEILKIEKDKKQLASDKDFLSAMDYENRAFGILLREIKTSNSETKEQDFQNAQRNHIQKMELLKAEEQAKLAELERYKNTDMQYFLQNWQAKQDEILRGNESQAVKNAMMGANDYQLRNSTLGLFNKMPENLERPAYFGAGANGAYQEAIFNSAEIIRIYGDAYAQLEAMGQLHSQTMLDLTTAYNEATRANHEQILQAERGIYEERLNMYNSLLGMAGGVWGQMTDIVKQSMGEQSMAFRAMFFGQKAIAAAQAVINTELAATQALAQGGAIFGIPMATAVRAMGYASAGIIMGQGIAGLFGKGFMTGGYTGNQPTNKVTGFVHGNEFVMNATATRNIGLPTLNAMNNGQSLPAQQGGVIINNYSSAKVQAEQVNGVTMIEVREEIDQRIRLQMADPNSAISQSIYRNTTAEPNR